jgi:hypothetical protein
MFEVGKPFIHANVAKETAIAMHSRIVMEETGLNAFSLLRGCMNLLLEKISDIIYEFKINIGRQQRVWCRVSR